MITKQWCIAQVMIYPLTLAALSGHWPIRLPPNAEKIKYFTVRAIFTIVVIVVYCLMLTSSIIDFCLNLDNITHLATNAIPTIFIAQSAFRVILLAWKRKEFSKMMLSCSLMARNCKFKIFQNEYYLAFERQIKVMQYMDTVFRVACTLLWAVAPLLVHEVPVAHNGTQIVQEIHIMHGWYPFDMDNPYVKDVIYAVHVTILILCTMHIMGCDYSFMTFFMFATHQQRHLKTVLKDSLLEGLSGKYPTNVTGQLEQSKGFCAPGYIVNQISSVIDPGVAHKISQKKTDVMEMRREGILGELKEWVKCHLEVIRLVDNINQISSTLVLVTFVGNAIQLCLMPFLLIQARGNWCIIGPIGAYFVLTITQTFLFCNIGQTVREESVSLSDALYEGNWPEASTDLNLMLLLHMINQRLQRPLAVVGGGFFILSLDFFTSLLGAVLAYFVVLVQLK